MRQSQVFVGILVLACAIIVAGCGGDDTEASSTTSIEAQPPPATSTRCVAADSNLMTPLGNGMKNMAHRLKNGQAVASESQAGIYVVSAEIYGEGVDEGTIGTWATRSLGGAEAIWTLDEVSGRYSDLRDGAKVANLSLDDDAVEESRACVEALG